MSASALSPSFAFKGEFMNSQKWEGKIMKTLVIRKPDWFRYEPLIEKFQSFGWVVICR